MSPATSVKKRCCSHQPVQTLLSTTVNPKETQDRNITLPSESSDTAATHWMEQPEETRDEKTGSVSQFSRPWIAARQASLSITNSLILAPNSWDAYQNNDLSEPRLFHLLIHRKALNPLRYLAFFKSNLLMLQLPCLPCKISYIFCPPPTPNPFYNPLCHHSLSELS